MANNISFKNFGDFLSKIILIYFALISSTLMVCVVFYFLVKDMQPSNEDLFFPLILLAVIMLFTSLFIIKFINGLQLKSINDKAGLSEKLSAYLTLQIIKFAMIEGIALFTLVGFFLTVNFLFFIVFFGALSFYIIERPSKEKFLFEVELTQEEKDIVMNNKSL